VSLSADIFVHDYRRRPRLTLQFSVGGRLLLNILLLLAIATALVTSFALGDV
jgi:hypothetical protein